MGASEEWSAELLDRLHARCGATTPDREHVVLSLREAPAVHRWLGAHDLTIADLLRDPDDRDVRLDIVPLVLIRAGRRTFAPDEDLRLARGDELLLAGRAGDLDVLSTSLYYDASVEYLATGRQVPTTWVGQLVTGRRSASRRGAPATAVDRQIEAVAEARTEHERMRTGSTAGRRGRDDA